MINSAKRLVVATVGGLLVASGAVVAQPGDASAVRVANTDSAVTQPGRGDFAGLEVTVSQTTGLVNQVIRVSWTGGKTTIPEFGNLGAHYLQIMQCWGGTPEDGPPREQCQYGTQKAGNGGQNTNSRQMTTAGFVDPREERYEDYRVGALSYIPFDSWNGKRTIGPRSEFFDRNTSNESNHNRTRQNGTGEDFFEIQTGIEAPGLGCGLSREGRTPLCWLVVVPRGEFEVDGTRRGLTYTEGLETSPLLTSNWANRLAFPLEFQPIGEACQIGGEETPLSGSDRISEAVARWQPAMCADGEGNFSYTVLSDQQARQKVVTDKPGLVFLGYGVDPETAPAPIVYAPIALSGLTIAFNVESQSSTLADKEIRLRDGQRISNVRLTQRLVAKLLTQSYRYDSQPDPSRVAKNPWDLAQDPDFLDLNPQFQGLTFPALGHMVTTLGQTDSARLVWDWIWADPEARAWMQGKPDPWGMRVNPVYKRESYPRSDYPRSDNTCVKYTDRVVALCTFDLFPYAGDLYAAARAASRGDTMSTGTYDPVALPPGYKKTPLQEPGRRAMVVVADTPLSDRFALTPAALRNAAGEYVVPSEGSLRKAASAALGTGVPGVVQPDPSKRTPGAYPLTSYTYAATMPGALSEEAAVEYARLISFASGPGQVVGEGAGRLPLGYSPLTEAEQASAAEAAEEIVRTAGEMPEPTAPPEPEPETPADDTGDGEGSSDDPGFSGDDGFTDSDTGSGYSDAGYSDSGFGDSGGSDSPVGNGTDEPAGGANDGTGTGGKKNDSGDEAVDTGDVEPVSTQALTPSSPAGIARHLIVALMVLGGSALLAGATLGRRAFPGRTAP